MFLVCVVVPRLCCCSSFVLLFLVCVVVLLFYSAIVGDSFDKAFFHNSKNNIKVFFWFSLLNKLFCSVSVTVLYPYIFVNKYINEKAL